LEKATTVKEKMMDIDKLTIGQAKEIAAIFGREKETRPSIMAEFIGKYVIVRSRNEGLNAGKLIAADDTGCVIEDARRLWYHEPADKAVSWYEGVAIHGLANSKAAPPRLKVIVEDYSCTLCTEKAEASIRGYEDHAQN